MGILKGLLELIGNIPLPVFLCRRLVSRVESKGILVRASPELARMIQERKFAGPVEVEGRPIFLEMNAWSWIIRVRVLDVRVKMIIDRMDFFERSSPYANFRITDDSMLSRYGLCSGFGSSQRQGQVIPHTVNGVACFQIKAWIRGDITETTLSQHTEVLRVPRDRLEDFGDHTAAIIAGMY